MKFGIDFLKNNPVFWSRLGFCYDPPIENEKGEPLVFTENFEKYLSTHRDFLKAGVKIHTSILHSGWVGVDKYDYRLTDRVLESVFSVGDDVLYLPRIKLNVPVDWCYENPEDVFVYYDGPRNADEIRALVGTERHDYLGYSSPSGYYRAGDYVDTRPNVGGLIARQSFSSDKWLHDATVALEKLIDRLESSPYADRIIGYHIAYGISGETVSWGRIDRHYGDYGINNRRKFYRYGIEKYGSRESLAKAWCQPDVSEDNLILPSPDERNGKTSDIEKNLRLRPEDRICIDYDLFISDTNADALLHFADVVKRKTDKLVGALDGYLLYISNPAYSGHLAIDRLLDSESIDFFSAPKSYARSGAGEPGGEICPAQSINLRKLFLEELDNRTYLAVENADDVKQGWVCADAHDSIVVMWRELAKNLSHDSGFWWMDLGGGWFASDVLMSTVSDMIKCAKSLRAKQRKSVADMLIVFDEKSFAYVRESAELSICYLREFITNTAAAGVVFDVYTASDLSRIDLSVYKLVVFAFDVFCDETTRELERILARTKTVKRSFGFAAWDDNKNPLSGVSEFEKQRAAAMLSTTDIPPFMKPIEIKEMARNAGCHIYCEAENVTVYSDSRFVGVFASATTDENIILLKRGDYLDVLSGEKFTDTDSVPLPKEKNAARFLLPI